MNALLDINPNPTMEKFILENFHVIKRIKEVLFTNLVLARTPGMQVAGIGHYPNTGAMD